MLFQSLGFLIFFTVFFVIYWLAAGRKSVRNVILFSFGLFLYSLWDIRFTLILIFMIFINFISAELISEESKVRKPVFYLVLILNLLPLLFFKYYNFFISGAADFTALLGFNFNLNTLNLILPVGISFYTFLSVSYLIDVYRRQIRIETNFVDYALSISYFPIIMSGPIHRPRLFLEQLKKDIKFEYDLAAEGLRQILTGLFLKVVVADNIARQANAVFSGYENLNGISVLLGTIYFSFQLYFDFNGYSEMAIGISKLLGFRISRNFKYPYLSRTIADFWRSWHISLTQWFRDYVFLPLSYIVSRKVKPGSVLDKDIFIYSIGIIITWTLTGLWHGAGWNYILWGMIHAILLILNKSFFKPKKKLLKRTGLKKDSLPVVIYEYTLTFIFVNFAWIFFRAGSSASALNMIGKIFDIPKWNSPEISLVPLMLIIFILIIEYFQREKEFMFEIAGLRPVFRWFVYIVAAVLIMYYYGNDQPFIYAGF